MNLSDLTACSEYSEPPDPPGSLEFLEMAKDLMHMHNLPFPTSVQEAIDLYVTMTAILESNY